MKVNLLIQRWGRFAAMVFLLIGITLAFLQAGPVAEHGIVMRYAFWLVTAAATFVSWWLSQWLVVSGHNHLSRTLLVVSSLVATLLFVPASLVIDLFFGMPDTASSWLWVVVEEWMVSSLPVFASCMIASLPAWLSATDSLIRVEAPSLESEPKINTAAEMVDDLLPIVVRGGVLRATADLQYVHLHSPEGVTTVPGPMRRITDRLSEQGMEVRRGEWIADRHVRQLKSARGRWVVLLKDGQQVTVSRRRLAEAKTRWGTTRYV